MLLTTGPVRWIASAAPRWLGRAGARAGGAVAASGLTSGAGLNTTVMPFILRAALLGIDSVKLPIDPAPRLGAPGGKPQHLADVTRDVDVKRRRRRLDQVRAQIIRVERWCGSPRFQPATRNLSSARRDALQVGLHQPVAPTAVRPVCVPCPEVTRRWPPAASGCRGR